MAAGPRLDAQPFAHETRSELVELHCTARSGVAADRWRRRAQADFDVSDATPAVAPPTATTGDPRARAPVIATTAATGGHPPPRPNPSVAARWEAQRR